MSYRVPAMAFLACLIASGAASARETVLENIPLKWSPTSTLAEMGPVDLSAADLTVKIHVEALVDTRQNPTLIAQNTEKPDKPRPVTTSSDVGGFVTEHLKDTLRAGGLNTVDNAGDVTLSGEIRRFFVTEVNVYRGEASLVLRLKDATGKELWTGAIVGDAERFGRSYRADNYYEVLSDTLLRAAHNLLANPTFHQALENH
jgi:Lipopolysaccharide-assembly